MENKNFVVECALKNLMFGKYLTHGILRHPESGYHFYGCGHDYKVLNLYIRYDDKFFDESFDGHIIFQARGKDSKPSFALYTSDFEYITSSDTPNDFCAIAIMEPQKRRTTEGSYDPEYDRIPICLKLSFSKFGKCVALVQNRDVCQLWMAEGEMMRKSIYSDISEIQALSGGISDE